MIKKFSKLAEKIGFTETETKVISFLISVFVGGSFAYFYKYKDVKKDSIQFNYSKQDSLFDYAGNKLNGSKQKNIEINVDSKQELLDFSNNKIKNRKKFVKTLTEKSININTADIAALCSLPGIGNSTAKSIINYRTKVKKFTAIKEIKKVKGIGNKKFNKIKKYLIIEK